MKTTLKNDLSFVLDLDQVKLVHPVIDKGRPAYYYVLKLPNGGYKLVTRVGLGARLIIEDMTHLYKTDPIFVEGHYLDLIVFSYLDGTVVILDWGTETLVKMTERDPADVISSVMQYSTYNTLEGFIRNIRTGNQ